MGYSVQLFLLTKFFTVESFYETSRVLPKALSTTQPNAVQRLLFSVNRGVRLTLCAHSSLYLAFKVNP